MTFLRIFRGRLWLQVALVALAAILAVAFWQPQRKEVRRIDARPTAASISSLLREADANLETGLVSDALQKYRQAIAIDPQSEKALQKLAAARAELLTDIQSGIEDGETTSAVEIAKEVVAGDPENKSAQEVIDAHGDTEEPWVPADLSDPAATPLSILPPVMSGYKITQNGWLDEPTTAGATYVPRSPAISQEIDRVFLTVSRNSGGGVERQAEREGELFSMASTEDTINNHPATFALYEEAHPDLYPTLASLYWTRGDWFFSLQVVPSFHRDTGTQPSADFKHGIAKRIAEELGY